MRGDGFFEKKNPFFEYLRKEDGKGKRRGG